MAVVILANNSVIGFVRVADADSDLHLVVATHWKDATSYREKRGILPGGFDGPEDPFVWTKNGRFHCLMHQWPMPYGTHAYSKDGVTWSYAPVTAQTKCAHNGRPCAYNGEVALKHANGSTSVTTLLARERPHLILDKNGVPLALGNGAVFPQRENGDGKLCKQAPPSSLSAEGSVQMKAGGVGYGCDRSVTFISPVQQQQPKQPKQ
jgi:hypothetical protein